jgi:hypothetical protein
MHFYSGQFTCFGQVQLPGCIAPSDTLLSQALDRGVNCPSAFLSWERCSVFAGGGKSSFKIIVLADKKYQLVLSVE